MGDTEPMDDGVDAGIDPPAEPGIDPVMVRRIVEAALLAAPQPVSLAQLAALFPDDAPLAPGAIEQALAELGEQAGERGVDLVEVASGFRYQVAADVQPWVARLWAERPPRYSRALLETLALIAYRQPITRGEIEQIRGVAVSSNIIKTLEEREWIRVVGHRDVPGKPALFGTTRGFLDYFGLKSLDQLPPLAELADIPELEPELPLDPVAVAPVAAPGDVDETPSAPIDPAAAQSDGEGSDDVAEAIEDADAVTSARDEDAWDEDEAVDGPPNDRAGDADAETRPADIASTATDHDEPSDVDSLASEADDDADADDGDDGDDDDTRNDDAGFDTQPTPRPAGDGPDRNDPEDDAIPASSEHNA